VTVVTREAYFRADIEILADLGYGGRKRAEVCGRPGVIIGSFRHYSTTGPSTQMSWCNAGRGSHRRGRSMRLCSGDRPGQIRYDQVCTSALGIRADD
jgi:hypothetical protein